MKAIPPKTAQQFFKWYCRNQLRDSILLDLDERFYQQLPHYGLLRSKINYWFSVIGFINRFTLRSSKSVSGVNYGSPLFSSNLKSSIRFLGKHKAFSFINILGLSLGLTSFLLILFFINHELSFDEFHKNKENVYRVNFTFTDNSGNETSLINSPPAFGPGISGQFPELLKVSRLRFAMNTLLANEGRSFYESRGYFADSLFLEILQFDFLAGNRDTALDDPNSIVLTYNLAIKYFGNEDPLGRTLLLNNSTPLKVSGVLSPVPSNSHLNFDFLISFSTYQVPQGYASDLESWDWLGFITYVELIKNTDPISFQHKLEKLFADLDPEDSNPMKPKVQNLSDIYLGSVYLTDDLASPVRSGNQKNVYTLVVIAFLIVIIAGFNFTNLTSALSIARGKAIAVRKTLGAQRSMVVIQLITESIFISLCCLLISYSVSLFIFPKLSFLLEWNIPLGFKEIYKTVPVMVVLALLIGLMAGSYPALVLSRINIIRSLKGELKTGKQHLLQPRNILVILQFTISIGLIASTIVLSQQVDYLSAYPTGYTKENVMVIKLLPEDMQRYYQPYKESLLQNSNIISVSCSDRAMGEPWPFTGITNVRDDDSEWKMTYFNLVDFDYFETMGVSIAAGRSFSESNSHDAQNSVIINQKAADLLGLKNPIGEQVHFFDANGPRTIVGVVNDFNYTSLHQNIGPVAMILPFIDVEYLLVRLSPGNLQDQIALVEFSWKEIAPGTPFEWKFMDEQLQQLYHAEAKLMLLIQIFSILAVLLACLGLYGIVTFMLNIKIKEYGIRKVFGASVASINFLSIKPYMYKILIAMVLVTPSFYYFLNKWLQAFAYRISINWWVIPFSTCILFVIALGTIIMQTTSAARANPAKVLRIE